MIKNECLLGNTFFSLLVYHKFTVKMSCTFMNLASAFEIVSSDFFSGILLKIYCKRKQLQSDYHE